MVYLFLAEGFEETEAITTADVLVRGGVSVKLISVTGEKKVKGSHKFMIEADGIFEETDFSNAELLILPGGMPGTVNLLAHKGLTELLKKQNEQGKRIAAICAAPMVLGNNMILSGKKAICYPGFEGELKNADVTDCLVVTDGNVTTSKGPATAINFGLELLKLLAGEEKADEVAKGMLFK